MDKKQLRQIKTMGQIKTMAKQSAGPSKNWITKYERKAYIKGYIQGALEWRC